MPEFEYKIMKMTHNWQKFYNDALACFGWNVESVEETVESIDTNSFGVSTGSGFSHGTATVFLPGKYSNTARIHGSKFDHTFGTQRGTEKSVINKLVAVKYRRDRNAPERDTLDWLEARCWPHISAYIERNKVEKYNFYWSEWQGVLRYRFLGENAIKAAGKKLPPAEGSFLKIFAEHNVIYEGQAGVNIHCKMNIKHRTSISVQRILYFMDESGGNLADKNECFNDMRGSVGAIVTVKPTIDDCTWEDILIFFPYSELHLKSGKHKLKYKLVMFDISTDNVVCESEIRELFYEQRGSKSKSYDNYPPELSHVNKKPDFSPTYLTKKANPQKKKGSLAVSLIICGIIIGVAIFYGLKAYRYVSAYNSLRDELESYLIDSMWEQQNEDGTAGKYAFIMVEGHEYSDELHVGLIGDTYDEILDNKSGVVPDDRPWRYNASNEEKKMYSNICDAIIVNDGYYTMDEAAMLSINNDWDVLTVIETSDEWGEEVEEIFSGTYVKVD